MSGTKVIPIPGGAIVIDIDTSGVEARLLGMIEQLEHFKRVDLGAGLSSFQTEDMHRQRPFTMRSRAKGTAATVVRPHSLYEMMRSTQAQRRFVRARVKYEKFLASGRRRRRRRPKYIRIAESGLYTRTSMRPILLAELYDKLHTRMSDLLAQKLKWSYSHSRAMLAHAVEARERVIKVLLVREFGAAGAAAVKVIDALSHEATRLHGGESE
jgi:hypothetical protein